MKRTALIAAIALLFKLGGPSKIQRPTTRLALSTSAARIITFVICAINCMEWGRLRANGTVKALKIHATLTDLNSSATVSWVLRIAGVGAPAFQMCPTSVFRRFGQPVFIATSYSCGFFVGLYNDLGWHVHSLSSVNVLARLVHGLTTGREPFCIIS